MADLLPSSPDPSAGDGGEPRVVGVDSEDADDLLAAIQSETARDLLAALYDDPATPSELADELDTSIQNVRYHLERLTDAELVEVADTVYSEKGREMNVYAPSAKPLVVFAGGEDDAPGLETALSRLLGALGVLGLSSVAIQRIFGGDSALFDVSWHGSSGDGSGGGWSDSSAATTAGDASAGAPNGGTVTESDSYGQGMTLDGGETVADEARTTVAESAGSPTNAPETVAETTRTVHEKADTRTVEEVATRTAEETTRLVEETTPRTTAETAAQVTEAPVEATTTVADAATGATSNLPPGLLFFAGGAVVLLALGVAWYLRAR